jgi:hypothetical protein
MRPTVEEQLQGTCRVLETVVAPQVSEPFARTILDNLVANLRMLTSGMPKIAAFLRHDNDATLQLLLALCQALPPQLVGRINDAEAAGEPDVADAEALENRNSLLRGMLAEAICNPSLLSDMRHAVVSHMIDRASRVPMRYVPTAPAANQEKEMTEPC